MATKITEKPIATVPKEQVQPVNSTAAAVNAGLQNLDSSSHGLDKEKSSTWNKKEPNQTNNGGYVAVTTTAAAPDYSMYDRTMPTTTDPELLSQYQNAMAALEQMKGQAPTYGNQYDAQIQSLYQQIIGRDPFKYDQKTDPLYQQYVQDYVMQGKQAMRDTMGRAAGLTGGYGSSYSQAVGQQQYDQYLQSLADILPQTYGMALDAYNAEGNRLNQNLSTTMGLEQSDYAKYLDSLNQYNIDLDRAYSEEGTWYDRMKRSEQETYNRQNDYYNRLVGLIASGYTPSKDDYAAAGLSEQQGEVLRAQYAPAPATSTSYYYTGGSNNTTAPASVDTSALDGLLNSYLNGSNSSVSKTGGTKKTKNTTTKKNTTAGSSKTTALLK